MCQLYNMLIGRSMQPHGAKTIVHIRTNKVRKRTGITFISAQSENVSEFIICQK